jgi:hypothetical protein
MPRRVLLSAASLLAFALVAPLAQAAETPAPTDAAAAPDAPESNAVDKVVVTAAPYAVSLDTVTSSVNVVTRDQLDTLPAAGIGDLLNGLPGLRSTFYGPGASRPVIRGLSGPRVMVLQNGVGQVDASSLSPDHAVASDPGEASRIEVLRGPSTLAYGGSGIGGVVNMIDDRVPSTPAANGPEGRLSASASSVDDGWAYSGAIKAGKGPFVFAADVSSRRTDDYSIPVAAVSDRLAARDGLTVDPDHVVKNTDVEVDGYGAGVSYVHDRGFIGLSVKKTDTTYGVPYEQILAPIDPNAEGPVSIHLQQTRYDLRGEQELDNPWFEKVRVSLGYADYEHAEVSVEDGEVGTRFLSDGTEGRVELVHREHDGHQGAIGFQALERHFEAIGDEAFVPSTKIKEYGIFTLQRLDRGTWGVDAGLRFDTRELTTPTQSRDFDNVSASLGVFYKPPAVPGPDPVAQRPGPHRVRTVRQRPAPGHRRLRGRRRQPRQRDRHLAGGHGPLEERPPARRGPPVGGQVRQLHRGGPDRRGRGRPARLPVLPDQGRLPRGRAGGQLRRLAWGDPVAAPGDHLRLGARRHRRRRARPHPAVVAGRLGGVDGAARGDNVGGAPRGRAGPGRDLRTAHRRLHRGQPQGHVQADRGLAPAAVRRRPQPDQRGDPRARLVPQGHRPVAGPFGAGGRGLEVLKPL